jgi:hypothetical protein|tara:strand:+ start:1041 stop:1490 length:450 start_codon:yes stop_codon:yes gene_type:complete
MQNINKTIHTTKCDNSVQLEIDLTAKNYSVNGHAVESVTMYVDTECLGDLAVNWAYDDSDNADYVDNTTLLMRNTNSDDNVTETMGKFYWDGEFTETLQQILTDNGFSASAVADVCTSEWGMQDEGRASYDAYTLGEELLNLYNLQLVA